MPGQPSGAAGSPVRVVSWNVHGWRDDPTAVRRGLRALRPDVVCLQEVYRGPGPWPWGTGTRHGLARLASDCGLEFVAGGLRAGGNAVLVGGRVRVRRRRALRLATPLFGPGPVWPAIGGRQVPAPRIGEGRGVVLVELGEPGRLLVACTHLDLEPDLRLQQAQEVVRLLRAWGAGSTGTGTPDQPPVPALVAADLNELPGGPAWAALGELLADPDPSGAETYSAQDPHQRIDAVLVGGPARVTGYRVGGIDPGDARRASDHLPVVAELELPG
ncbi:MAG TPA: endonuclease/exonuclease/phosphatase family protein [Kineosporiaceae bacterium]|nr:endonuclease/exonuclease/phosphatase family protein [Kineosporiaceae bacterium]